MRPFLSQQPQEQQIAEQVPIKQQHAQEKPIQSNIQRRNQIIAIEISNSYLNLDSSAAARSIISYVQQEKQP